MHLKCITCIQKVSHLAWRVCVSASCLCWSLLKNIWRCSACLSAFIRTGTIVVGERTPSAPVFYPRVPFWRVCLLCPQWNWCVRSAFWALRWWNRATLWSPLDLTSSSWPTTSTGIPRMKISFLPRSRRLHLLLLAARVRLQPANLAAFPAFTGFRRSEGRRSLARVTMSCLTSALLGLSSVMVWILMLVLLFMKCLIFWIIYTLGYVIGYYSFSLICLFQVSFCVFLPQNVVCSSGVSLNVMYVKEHDWYRPWRKQNRHIQSSFTSRCHFLVLCIRSVFRLSLCVGCAVTRIPSHSLFFSRRLETFTSVVVHILLLW